MQCDLCGQHIELSTKACPHCGVRVPAALYGPMPDATRLVPPGTDDATAVQRLVDITRDPAQDSATVRRAALLLGEVEDPGEDVVRALVNLLAAVGKRTRLCAIAGLRQLGPAARSAVPALTSCLTADSRAVIGAATTTLAAIDPEAAMPAAVVADLLALSETSLQHAFDLVSSGVAFLDATGQLIRSNSAFREISAAIGADPYGRFPEHLLAVGLLDTPEVWGDLVAGRRESVVAEKRVPCGAAGRWISLRTGRALDMQGRFIYILLTLDDITESRSIEEYIRATNEQLTQELSTRRAAEAALVVAVEERRQLTQTILTAQEDERRRIARELHDQVGQALSAVLVGIRPLDGVRESRERAARTAELRRITTQALHDVRRLAFDMRPSSLDHLGLSATLEQDAARFREQLGVAVHFHGEGRDQDRLPPELETAVYRATHTALMNVLHHSQARNVSVLVTHTTSDLSVIVEDDGVGFDVDAVLAGPVGGRFGLLSMEERVRPFGGRVNVESAAGVGTAVFIQVALPAAGA